MGNESPTLQPQTPPGKNNTENLTPSTESERSSDNTPDILGDNVSGDKVLEDKVTAGDITNSTAVAIGPGATANVYIHETQNWITPVGAIAGAGTLLFFMGIVISSLFGYEVPYNSRFAVVVVLALGSALTISFLGGRAVSEGLISLPLLKYYPRQLSAISGIVVLLVVILLGNWIYLRAPAEPKPTVDLELNQLPGLPTYAPPITTTIQIADLQDCPDEYREIEPTLKEMFSNETPPIYIDDATSSPHSPVDLVISCQTPNIQFAIQVAKGSPSVYEPSPLELTLKDLNNTQTAQLAYALGKYLQRNYDESAKTLATLNESSVSVESQALLQLMRGNSLIFMNSYMEAVEAYQQAVTLKPDWAGAYHNLGVAQMNQAWETSEFSSALDSFSQTLRLDPNFSLSYITIGELWRWKGIVDGSPDYLNQAENDCQLAITSSERHIVNYATVCLTSIQVTRYALSLSTASPDINESQLKSLATPYWSLPLITMAANDYLLWQKHQDNFTKAQAKEELLAAYQQGQDDVQLESARSDYEAIRLFLNALQNN